MNTNTMLSYDIYEYTCVHDSAFAITSGHLVAASIAMRIHTSSLKLGEPWGQSTSRCHYFDDEWESSQKVLHDVVHEFHLPAAAFQSDLSKPIDVFLVEL